MCINLELFLGLKASGCRVRICSSTTGQWRQHLQLQLQPPLPSIHAPTRLSFLVETSVAHCSCSPLHLEVPQCKPLLSKRAMQEGTVVENLVVGIHCVRRGLWRPLQLLPVPVQLPAHTESLVAGTKADPPLSVRPALTVRLLFGTQQISRQRREWWTSRLATSHCTYHSRME